ncbi:MAG TPA: SagB/ThcOx family dehydrogenase [Ilumatobacteraceae bacterium]|nr:SagB/ThcOx family dehydrogenase [Ilumatobacteraceae bacterium]
MRDRAVAGFACVVLAGAIALGCVAEAPDSITAETQRFDEIADLPAPDLTGEVSLEQTLVERRSGREFAGVELTPDVIGQLFWAGQGITDERGYRTAPSAGALYPLELYAVTASAVMHYVPDGHRVESRSDTTVLARLGDLAFGQDVLTSAPVVLVVVGVDARTEAEYGALAADFVEREAGHATQNILLQAAALDLAAVPVGGFDPAGVARLIALPAGHEVIYLVPVGEPVGADGS